MACVGTDLDLASAQDYLVVRHSYSSFPDRACIGLRQKFSIHSTLEVLRIDSMMDNPSDDRMLGSENARLVAVAAVVGNQRFDIVTKFGAMQPRCTRRAPPDFVLGHDVRSDPPVKRLSQEVYCFVPQETLGALCFGLKFHK